MSKIIQDPRRIKKLTEKNPNRYSFSQLKSDSEKSRISENAGYKAAGKNPVRITDYPAPAGMGGISYSHNGVVSVGGREVPVLYMDGDRAVVDSNELDRAYAGLQNQTGIKTADSLYNDWHKNYGKRAENAYADMAGYGDWEYNPEKDPAYSAYSDMYKREGERAYRDAAARLASKNMGNMTSAAQTVANQQLGYYMSMLADRIPELMKNSYERYKNGFDMKKEAYNAAADSADKGWKRMYEVNDTNKKDYADWQDKERQRTLDRQADDMWKLKAESEALNNRLTEARTEGERLYNTRTGVLTEGDRLQNELTGVKTEGERIANENALLKKAALEAANLQNAVENAWANGERRGYYTDEEMAILNMVLPEENGEDRYYRNNRRQSLSDIVYELQKSGARRFTSSPEVY